MSTLSIELQTLILAGLAFIGAVVVLLLFGTTFQKFRSHKVPGKKWLGSVARVTLSIPEDGVGTITLLFKGSQISLPASGTEGMSLPEGEEVVIVEFKGRVAHCLPLFDDQNITY